VQPSCSVGSIWVGDAGVSQSGGRRVKLLALEPIWVGPRPRYRADLAWDRSCMFRCRSRWWLALMVVVLLGGCGARTSPSQPTASLAAGTPKDLIGLWWLEAVGEAPGTVLRIGRDLSLWRPCSVSWGAWAATAEGRFLADLSSYSYGCAGPKPTAAPKPGLPPAPATPAWLTNASAWRADGVERILEDTAGRTVARLSPGGKPFPNPNVASELSAPPSLDSQLAMRLRPARKLPPALSAAAAADVLGTWYPQPLPGAPAPPVRPFTAFTADGRWTGSDGCNSTAGRWSLGPDGSLLATADPSTDKGCVGQDKVPRLTSAKASRIRGPSPCACRC
jgi:META domain